MKWTTVAAMALCMLAVTCNAWAQDSTIDFIDNGPADWNTDTNWNAPGFGNAVPGDGFPQEFASISNAGIAELTAPALHDILGLVIGETHNPARPGGPNATQEDGTLIISGTGQLRLIDPGDMGRAALRIGDAGRGVLSMSGGSAFTDTLLLAGAADSRLRLSDGARLGVSGDANLLRNTQLTGPDVVMLVEGNLQVRGTFVTEITGGSHSAIQVPAGDANLGGTLRPVFNGHSPTLGDTWDLIQAGTVTGVFDNIDLSQAPQLPRGTTFDVSYHDAGSGGVVLSVVSIVRQPGDTDGDGIVRIDDLNNVRNHFGTSGPADGTLPGDAFPFDGMVNIDDVNGVLNNFGVGVAENVPEPATIVTCLLGMAIIAWRISRRV